MINGLKYNALLLENEQLKNDLWCVEVELSIADKENDTYHMQSIEADDYIERLKLDLHYQIEHKSKIFEENQKLKNELFNIYLNQQ